MGRQKERNKGRQRDRPTDRASDRQREMTVLNLLSVLKNHGKSRLNLYPYRDSDS